MGLTKGKRDDDEEDGGQCERPPRLCFTEKTAGAIDLPHVFP